MTPKTPDQVFGGRAAYYTTSAIHRDPVSLGQLVQLAAPQPDWRALDLATGAGHTALALAPLARYVVGLDMTPEMLHEAAGLRDREGIANAHFCLGDVHALPFGAESFPLVTCRRAAHHFRDIRLALAEVERVLAPGGRVVIDDRSVPEDDFVDAFLNRLDVLHDASHFRSYRAREWADMLRDAGLHVDALQAYSLLRPLSAFTSRVEPEGVAQIEALVNALDADQRQALGLVERDGEIHMNHWYVLVAATKALADGY